MRLRGSRAAFPRAPLLIGIVLLFGVMVPQPARSQDAANGDGAEPGWIGIFFGRPDGSPTGSRGGRTGVRLIGVLQGSPAHRAGLRPGDVVLGLDGRAVTPEALGRVGSSLRVGERVRLVVERDGVRDSLELVAGRRPAAGPPAPGGAPPPTPRRPARPGLDRFPDPYVLGRNYVAGAEVASLNPELSSYFSVDTGVLVTEVIEGSPAETAGLVPGDVVTAVEGISCETVEELRRALLEADLSRLRRDRGSAEVVTLTIVRRGREESIRMTR